MGSLGQECPGGRLEGMGPGYVTDLVGGGGWGGWVVGGWVGWVVGWVGGWVDARRPRCLTPFSACVPPGIPTFPSRRPLSLGPDPPPPPSPSQPHPNQARFTKGHLGMKCYGLGLGLDTFR